MKLRTIQHSNRENGRSGRDGALACPAIASERRRTPSAPRSTALHPGGGNAANAAFTLAEVLAALAFLAILIPTVVECLNIASRAGEVAERKAHAARVAENVLNESIITTNWSQSSQNGTVSDGTAQYNWTLESSPWTQDPMRVLTVDVKYSVQNKDYSVQLSTLVDESTLYSTNS